MSLALFSGMSSFLLGEKHNKEREISDLTEAIANIQNLSSLLADGQFSPDELQSSNSLATTRTAAAMSGGIFNSSVAPAMNEANFYINGRMRPPVNNDPQAMQQYQMETARVKQHFLKQMMEEKGKALVKRLSAKETMLTHKKDRAEKRLQMIEKQLESYDKSFTAAAAKAAPKFGGGQG